jgi:phage host-nuclease inhibitor protein Gam
MSEEEFSALRRICAATGARSLSDLAREAMRGLLSATHQQGAGDGAKDEYSAQMKDLEQKVEKLRAEIALFKADRNLQADVRSAQIQAGGPEPGTFDSDET